MAWGLQRRACSELGEWKECRAGEPIKGYYTKKGATLRKGNGPNEKSYGWDEGEHEKNESIEDLVHRTDSPFMASINDHPLPPKFKMLSLDSYDGTRDPFNHIATFKTTMHLQGVLNKIMCRAFPTTLKGPARVWFSKIPPNSVSSFEELSKLFVNNFIGGQWHKRSLSSLLTKKQGENESLRSFIIRFNREALKVVEVDDKLLLMAFHNGVNSNLFIHKLYEKKPQSMAELVHLTQNFMNAEDAIIAKKRKRSERIEANPGRHSE